MSELSIKENYIPEKVQEPMMDRIRRCWNNLKVWKVGRANKDLHNAMKKDPYFAHTWQEHGKFSHY